MRLARAGLFALLWTVGCLRFGYDERRQLDPKPDAGTVRERDAAGDEAAGRGGAGSLDAGTRDASVPEPDANLLEDASRPSDAAPADGATLEPNDAEILDVSSGDGGEDARVGGDAGDAGRAEACAELPNALFCEDFEGPGFDRWLAPIVSNGALERSTGTVRSGQGALRATTGVASAAGATSEARLVANAFDNQRSGDLWLRYYYFMSIETVIESSFSTATIAETQAPYFEFALSLRQTGMDIVAGNAFYRRTTVFPRGAWTCVEMHVQLAAAGVFEVFLNGASAIRAETDTVPETGYVSFDVGIRHRSSTQGPIEVFVDDVVAATTRVGCD